MRGLKKERGPGTPKDQYNPQIPMRVLNCKRKGFERDPGAYTKLSTFKCVWRVRYPCLFAPSTIEVFCGIALLRRGSWVHCRSWASSLGQYCHMKCRFLHFLLQACLMQCLCSPKYSWCPCKHSLRLTSPGIKLFRCTISLAHCFTTVLKPLLYLQKSKVQLKAEAVWQEER